MARAICVRCLEAGDPAHEKKGSGGLELLLWLFGLFVGIVSAGMSILVPLVYSIWRRSWRPLICGHCGSGEIVSIDSPRGMLLDEERSRALNERPATASGRQFTVR